MVLLRREIGDVLREARQYQGRTLREVSATASCSLTYLSEVERGEKEVSSEVLSAICKALDVPLSEMLGAVADRVQLAEAADTVMTTVLTDSLSVPRAQQRHVVRRSKGRRTVVPAA